MVLNASWLSILKWVVHFMFYDLMQSDLQYMVKSNLIFEMLKQPNCRSQLRKGLSSLSREAAGSRQQATRRGEVVGQRVLWRCFGDVKSIKCARAAINCQWEPNECFGDVICNPLTQKQSLLELFAGSWGFLSATSVVWSVHLPWSPGNWILLSFLFISFSFSFSFPFDKKHFNNRWDLRVQRCEQLESVGSNAVLAFPMCD
jgi:hypothetical protein